MLCLILNVQDANLSKIVSTQAQQISEKLEPARAVIAVSEQFLQQTVLALQETNRLANLRIAVLIFLIADAPKAVAVSLWDNNDQDGVLVVQNTKRNCRQTGTMSFG